MFKEAIETLADLAVKAKAPKIIRDAAEPAHHYWTVDGMGNMKKEIAAPHPRDHKAQDLESVVDFCNVEGSRIWYSRNGVIGLIVDEERRDKVSLKLTYTPQLLTLLDIERQKYPEYDQKSFLKLLRIALHDCLGSAPDLVDSIRAVKFELNSEAQGRVGHKEESLGRSMKAKLTGDTDVPEFVELTVPIFANLPGKHERVKCAIDISLEKQQFRLIPLPGELENALREGEAGVHDRIRQQFEGSVLYGEP